PPQPGAAGIAGKLKPIPIPPPPIPPIIRPAPVSAQGGVQSTTTDAKGVPVSRGQPIRLHAATDEKKFLKGLCQSCSGHLEFLPTSVGETILCPHCGLSTVLSALPVTTAVPPRIPEPPRVAQSAPAGATRLAVPPPSLPPPPPLI